MAASVQATLAALEHLGLNEAEAHLYRSLLQMGRATVGELSSHCAHSRAKIYGLLDNLVARGVVKEVAPHPRTFAPVDPRWLATARLAEVEEAVKVAEATLGPLYEARHRDYSETLSLRDLELFKQVEAMYRRASMQVDLVAAFLTPSPPPSLKEALAETAQRGVTVRLLLPDRLPPDTEPPPLDLFQVRVAPTPAAGMVIVDDTELLMGGLEPHGQSSQIVGVWIHNRELVRFSRLIFEKLFAEGEPY